MSPSGQNNVSINSDVIKLIKIQDEDTTVAGKYLTYRPLDKNETGGGWRICNSFVG